MNFQPPDPEDDPRDDDQRMRDAELEAHRVRFEQAFAKANGLTSSDPVRLQRHGEDYGPMSHWNSAWQAYQWALADADRAQRAAPGVQGGEPTPWRNEMMDMAIAAGVAPNTIFHFEAAFLRFAESLEKKINTAQPPQQSAQPVAAANGWAKGLEIRMSQGWKLKGGICPVLYSDTVNGYGVGRDDLWLATTDALKSAQPVEVPSDFHTHKNAWRSALEMAEQNALVNPPDLDDKSYWRHEIAAFDRAYSELGAQPVEVQRVPLTGDHLALPTLAPAGLVHRPASRR